MRCVASLASRSTPFSLNDDWLTRLTRLDDLFEFEHPHRVASPHRRIDRRIIVAFVIGYYVVEFLLCRGAAGGVRVCASFAGLLAG